MAVLYSGNTYENGKPVSVGGVNKLTLDSKFEDIVLYFMYATNSNKHTAEFKAKDILRLQQEFVTSSDDIVKDAAEDETDEVDNTTFTYTMKSVSLENITKSLADKYSYLSDPILKKVFLFLCYSSRYTDYTNVDELGNPICFNSLGSSNKELLNENKDLNTNYLPNLKSYLAGYGEIDHEVIINEFNVLFPKQIYGDINFSEFIPRCLQLIINQQANADDGGNFAGKRLWNHINKCCHENGHPEAINYYDEHTKKELQDFMRTSRNLHKKLKVLSFNFIDIMSKFLAIDKNRIIQLIDNINEDRKDIVNNSIDEVEVETDEEVESDA